MDVWGGGGGGADRKIIKSRSNDTKEADAVGGGTMEMSQGLAEGCMEEGRRSLRRLEGG